MTNVIAKFIIRGVIVIKPVLFSNSKDCSILDNLKDAKVKDTCSILFPCILQVRRMMLPSSQLPTMYIPSLLCIYRTAYVHLASNSIDDSINAHYLINFGIILWLTTIKYGQIQLNRIERLSLKLDTWLDIVFFASPCFREVSRMLLRVSKRLVRFSTTRICQLFTRKTRFFTIAQTFRKACQPLLFLFFCHWMRYIFGIHMRLHTYPALSREPISFVLIKKLCGSGKELIACVAISLSFWTLHARLMWSIRARLTTWVQTIFRATMSIKEPFCSREKLSTGACTSLHRSMRSVIHDLNCLSFSALFSRLSGCKAYTFSSGVITPSLDNHLDYTFFFSSLKAEG